MLLLRCGKTRAVSERSAECAARRGLVTMSKMAIESCPATELRVFSALMWQGTAVSKAAERYRCVSPAFARSGVARAMAAEVVQQWSAQEVFGLLLVLDSARADARSCEDLGSLRVLARSVTGADS